MGGVRYLLGRSLPKTICHSEKRSDEESNVFVEGTALYQDSRSLAALGMTTQGNYFVLPPSTFSFSLAPAWAAAKRAVNTRNGEQET